jgi:hypothetical protein
MLFEKLSQGQITSSTHVGGQPDTSSKSGKYVAVYNAKTPDPDGEPKIRL